jgi:hypothetical protein
MPFAQLLALWNVSRATRQLCGYYRKGRTRCKRFPFTERNHPAVRPQGGYEALFADVCLPRGSEITPGLCVIIGTTLSLLMSQAHTSWSHRVLTVLYTYTHVCRLQVTGYRKLNLLTAGIPCRSESGRRLWAALTQPTTRVRVVASSASRLRKTHLSVSPAKSRLFHCHRQLTTYCRARTNPEAT